MPTLTLRRTAAAAAVAALAASVAIAQPASAGDITVTATVTAAEGASALYVAHEGSADLGPTTFSPDTAKTVIANLPTTRVTDQRGTLAAGWTVAVSGTDLKHGDFANNGESIPASNARVYLNITDLSSLEGLLSGMTVSGAEYLATGNNLSSSYMLIEGTTNLGNGWVDYTPTMNLTVPSGTPVGTYTTTVTQTVS